MTTSTREVVLDEHPDYRLTVRFDDTIYPLSGHGSVRAGSIVRLENHGTTIFQSELIPARSRYERETRNHGGWLGAVREIPNAGAEDIGVAAALSFLEAMNVEPPATP